MSAAILVGDIHLTDPARHPTSRTSEYTEQILDKIRFVSDEAKRRNVPIVQAGDVFHAKSSYKNSHELVQRFHEALDGVRTFIVPGNHDLSHDRLESLGKQPLGALSRMDNVDLLMGSHPDLPGIYGIPYLTEFDSNDKSWQESLNQFISRSRTYAVHDENWEDSASSLIVTHAPLFPPGSEPKGLYNYIDTKEWANFFRADAGPINTYYGHIHDCHGVYTVNDHQFCNQGALSRGSLHESSINRAPAVTYWNGETNFERIEVPHLPAEQVFLFEKAAQKVANKVSAEEFDKAVGSASLETLDIESVRDILKGQVSNPKVMEIVEECLEYATG